MLMGLFRRSVNLIRYTILECDGRLFETFSLPLTRAARDSSEYGIPPKNGTRTGDHARRINHLAFERGDSTAL